MNNLIKLLGVVLYCVFVTHYVGQIYPSLSFYYYILEFGLLIHVYKVITNNKSNIDDYMGVTYAYTLYPQLRDVEKKRQVLIKGLVYVQEPESDAGICAAPPIQAAPSEPHICALHNSPSIPPSADRYARQPRACLAIRDDLAAPQRQRNSPYRCE